MKKEKINIEIARACGWKWNSECDIGGKAYPECWTNDSTAEMRHYSHELPNYYGSLDACAEFESFMFSQYETLEGADRLSIYTRFLCILEHPLFASAPQRCEAFWKTMNIGPWEDEE
jgi:hypothetical protein